MLNPPILKEESGIKGNKRNKFWCSAVLYNVTILYAGWSLTFKGDLHLWGKDLGLVCYTSSHDGKQN